MLHLPLPLFPLSVHPLDLVLDATLVLYALSLAVLFVVAGQGFILLALDGRERPRDLSNRVPFQSIPIVTIQLPVFNELHVVERLIRAVCAIDHPRDKFEVQVLDDSSDATADVIAALVNEYRSAGVDIRHIRRHSRRGFKAGALQEGLQDARGEFIAIFDADFVPRPSFLRETMPHFADPSVGLVQTRWEHLNAAYSPLTRVQEFGFDMHFAVEQRVRSDAGQFLVFNGTGGIWRKRAIVDAGGWHDDTLTEDLDLSYRAQLRGWRLVFLNGTTSPSELPADFNALRAQQYRWTKGFAENTRKLLPLVWRSTLPPHRKALATLHLTAVIAFPFMVIVAVLNGPVAAITSAGEYGAYYAVLSVFALGFVSMLLAHLRAQRVLHRDWLRRMTYFPAFVTGSLGLSLSNAAAVIDGLTGRAGTFLRTPKSGITNGAEAWTAGQYAQQKATRLVFGEIVLGLYCFFGAVSSLYRLEFSAVPFQLMFAAGFMLVAGLSLKHARDVRRSRTTHTHR